MKTPEQRQIAAQQGHEKLHGDMLAFHQREVEKYAAKVEQLTAAGKHKAAARAQKVVERNRRKVAEHAAKLEGGAQ